MLPSASASSGPVPCLHLAARAASSGVAARTGREFWIGNADARRNSGRESNFKQRVFVSGHHNAIRKDVKLFKNCSSPRIIVPATRHGSSSRCLCFTGGDDDIDSSYATTTPRAAASTIPQLVAAFHVHSDGIHPE